MSFETDYITWIGDPATNYSDKLGRYPQGTLWPFTIKDNSTIFFMDEYRYQVYLAEKAMLENFFLQPLDIEIKAVFLGLIEKYGDARENKGKNGSLPNYKT